MERTFFISYRRSDADELNRVSVGGAPLGFWIAQQGGIYLFVILTAVYAALAERLDRQLGDEERQ